MADIHYFDTNIAKEYGVNCAIILQNIDYWIKKNEANDKHYHDGCYWTYSSATAFEKLFPYMTQRQIRYALKKLRDSGIIITANYSDKQYDHTLWYAITPKGRSVLNASANLTDSLSAPKSDFSADNSFDVEKIACSAPSNKIVTSIRQNCHIDMTKMSNRNDNSVTAITDNKTDNNNLYNPSIHRNNINTCARKEEKTDGLIDEPYTDNQKRTVYKAILEKNIDFEYVSLNYPTKQKEIQELRDLMLDVICLGDGKYKINGFEVSSDSVKSRFLKLTTEDIDYVLEAFGNITEKIYNPRNYLIAMLYNSHTASSHEITNRVNNDRYYDNYFHDEKSENEFNDSKNKPLSNDDESAAQIESENRDNDLTGRMQNLLFALATETDVNRRLELENKITELKQFKTSNEARANAG